MRKQAAPQFVLTPSRPDAAPLPGRGRPAALRPQRSDRGTDQQPPHQLELFGLPVRQVESERQAEPQMPDAAKVAHRDPGGRGEPSGYVGAEPSSRQHLLRECRRVLAEVSRCVSSEVPRRSFVATALSFCPATVLAERIAVDEAEPVDPPLPRQVLDDDPTPCQLDRRARRQRLVDVPDALLETAFERLGVAYFDGFVGSLRARFRTDLVEAAPADSSVWLPSFVARLWKLHGSVNWVRDPVADGSGIVRTAAAVDGSPAAIYPSDTKYVDSRRVPFVVLHDRLRRALTEPETLVLIAGYSWGDQDLNEIFFEAATRRQRSEYIAFCYSAIPEVLAEHATSTPNLQAVAASEAVLGGLRGSWATPDPVPAGDIWNDGKLALHDYRNLATFLARSSPPHGELEARLAEALAATS